MQASFPTTCPLAGALQAARLCIQAGDLGSSNALCIVAGSKLVQSSAGSFPQNHSLAGALQEAQLCVLGRIMAVVSPSEQARMLDGLKASFSGKAGKQRDLKPDPQQHGVTVRACLAALTGLQAIADLYKGR